ncbi:MAG: sigma-70 family RNA polymerase sigma factor [Sedimentisphaerales bacterium]|nr:sigma-70 family RNA polymerase sigma factor [Sedimentisphaerales bacterium]
MPESEFVLLRRFAANGDAEAFSEIVKQHASLVYGVCIRILGDKHNATDAVQDTFLQLVRDAAKITGSLPNWLHRTATNRAIDIIRQDSQRKKREFNYATRPKIINAEDNKAAWREISVFIDEELENLDDHTREVIILRFFENLTTNDIAKKCDISQQKVYRWMDSGIELLRQKLKSRGVIVPAAVFMTLLSDNIVKAAPASIMRELGKIAIAGSRNARPYVSTIGTKIASYVSTGITVKMKLIAGMMIVLAGAGLTVVFSFIANGENKPASIWELVTKTESDNKITGTKPETNIANITAGELFAKYTQALESTKSFISKGEHTIYSEDDLGSDAPAPELMGYKSKMSKFSQYEIRWDGKRLHVRSYNWNELNPPKESRIREKAGDFRLMNFNNGQLYRHSMAMSTEGPAGFIMVNDIDSSIASPEQSFQGYFWTSNNRLDKVLEDAKSISLRSEMEEINDSKCYVLDTHINLGKISIWIDPAHGYQLAKFEVKCTEGDYAPGSKLKKGQSFHNLVQFGNFKQIDDIWVPMEYKASNEHIFGPEGKHMAKLNYKRTEIVLNPDHDALGSFDSPLKNPKNDPELRNGTPVQIAGFKRFTWNDGKLLDENGEVFDLDNLKPISLLGKALPKFTEVRLDPDAIKNKKLLVCFWKIDDSKSTDCIKTLNKRAEALLDTRDVYMVFIHVGSIADEMFHSWLRENEILPPTGYSTVRLKGLGYGWGVQSVPWLILTDKNHIVTAEGFSITELDEKIKD